MVWCYVWGFECFVDVVFDYVGIVLLCGYVDCYVVCEVEFVCLCFVLCVGLYECLVVEFEDVVWFFCYVDEFVGWYCV